MTVAFLKGLQRESSVLFDLLIASAFSGSKLNYYEATISVPTSQKTAN